MSPGARVAVYYAPGIDDPLFELSNLWLGRNPVTGAACAQPNLPDIAAVTADPCSYGFHATLKPPMRLAPGRNWEDFAEAARVMAAGIAPFMLPPLAVQNLHGFLALRETQPCTPLQTLADICVQQLDSYRAPPGEAELARRRRAPLTPEQDAMLVRWGYPYVFQTWFFHMTLTRRLTPAEHAVYRPAAEALFAEAAAAPRMVTDICLFTQAEPSAPFMIAESLPLGG